MFETDGLPKAWVDACNTQDEIWVPTAFNAESFARAGVRVPLVTVPGGVDAQVFRPDVPPLPLPGRRRVSFLSIFKWEYRKGWDVLLRAWARAFHPDDDVCLYLRTYPADVRTEQPGPWVAEQIQQFLREDLRVDVAPIIVLDDEVSDTDLPALYTACDVYLAPSRGEGWGRPQIEAMAAGRAVMATRWSGHLEFMTEETVSFIDVERLVPAGPGLEDQNWAEPSVEDLAVKMCRLAFDAAGRRALGARARAHVTANFTWSRAAALAEARLQPIIDRLARTIR